MSDCENEVSQATSGSKVEISRNQASKSANGGAWKLPLLVRVALQVGCMK